VVTKYHYDEANCLKTVNGQACTWDEDGNLLEDGQKQYRYDQAGRLVGITATGCDRARRSTASRSPTPWTWPPRW
jgi:YD repeat-containing protein